MCAYVLIATMIHLSPTCATISSKVMVILAYYYYAGHTSLVRLQRSHIYESVLDSRSRIDPGEYMYKHQLNITIV